MWGYADSTASLSTTLYTGGTLLDLSRGARGEGGVREGCGVTLGDSTV